MYWCKPSARLAGWLEQWPHDRWISCRQLGADDHCADSTRTRHHHFAWRRINRFIRVTAPPRSSVGEIVGRGRSRGQWFTASATAHRICARSVRQTADPDSHVAIRSRSRSPTPSTTPTTTFACRGIHTTPQSSHRVDRIDLAVLSTHAPSSSRYDVDCGTSYCSRKLCALLLQSSSEHW